MPKQVLLVDSVLARLELAGVPNRLRDLADVIAAADFPKARRLLIDERPDLVVTNLRLGDYNGIHLALLADRASTRVIVYTEELDLGFAREVREAGAFYERLPRLAVALPPYLQATLPPADLRDPATPDRRRTFRRGRRATDVQGVFEALYRPAHAAGEGLR